MELTISQIIAIVIGVIAASILLYFVITSLQPGPFMSLPVDISP